MQFDPNKKYIPLAEGKEYTFTVAEAKEKKSQSGNPCLNLKLYIDGENDNQDCVYDTLTTSPKMIWRLEKFCQAVGLDFQSGNISGDACIGLRGRCVLQLGQPRQSTGKRYLEPKEYLPLLPEHKQENDDIPF